MSYRHPRWYDYGKTDADFAREKNGLLVLLLIATPFTYGISLIAATFVLADIVSANPISAKRRKKNREWLKRRLQKMS